MADDHRQPHERVLALARELVRVAFAVAFASRTNALRKRGRAFTSRAVKMWSGARSQRETKRVIAAAFADLDMDHLPNEKQIHLALIYLKWTLREERNPRPGTRPRPRPLLEIERERALQTAKLSVGTGRPRLLSDQDERGWLALFYGVKVRLLMTEGGYTIPIDFADAVKKAKAEVKSRGGLTFLDGDCGVSDRRVLCEMRSEDPSVSLAALRSRLRRARQRQQISLFE